MIREFSIHAKPSNNKAKIATVVLLTLSLLNFIAYAIMRYFEVQKSGLAGVLVIALITSAVFIYTKYVSCEYYYDVTFDYENTPVFVVRQTSGKRTSTLCHINLSDILTIKRESVGERREHKTPKGYVRYVYVPTLFPEHTYRLTLYSRYEKAEIIIECSDGMAMQLLDYSRIAKEEYSSGDE